MNIENLIERFCRFIIFHKKKTLVIGLILIAIITSGASFLETPTGYRAFVENDQPNYADILDLEEKYGMIDTLSFVIKPNEGDIFQKDVLKLIKELTEISWQTPHSTRVNSLTNHQYTTVDGDDINISDFVDSVESLDNSDLKELKELALKEKTLVNFILSKSAKVSFINIYLDVPDQEGFEKPINFAEKQKKLFSVKSL